MDNSELTLKARAVARCLTYNEDIHQSEAKHLLRELSHRLDSLSVRVHKKKDGLLFINGIGKSRFATFKETILFKLFGVTPNEI